MPSSDETHQTRSSAPPAIRHPRSLLIVGTADCDIAGLVKDLTGISPPLNSEGSVAGSIHAWSIRTDYYTAEVPLWIDQIDDLTQWQSDFSQSEAKEVVQALAGWVCCFTKPGHDTDDATQRCETLLKAVDDIIRKACGYEWDGIRLAVAMKYTGVSTGAPTISAEVWDDLCMDRGFEFVDAEASGKNEYGERLGLRRITEAVEANDWATSLTDDSIEDVEPFGDFGEEQEEANAELWGLKASLLEGGSDDGLALGSKDSERAQVDDLEGLMQQALAIKESSADLPAEQRKRYAAKAIDRLMNDHGL